MEYRFIYDDPYSVLAHVILTHYRPADVIRMLTDNEYLLNCITKEIRQQDFCGIFLDCIIEDILAQKKRMDLMHQYDILAHYFYQNLDKKRLRNQLIGALSEIGIEIS